MPEIRKGINPSPRASQTNEAGFSKRTSQTNENNQHELLTAQDLNNILELNQKSLTIYLEVERQNSQILEVLKEQKETLEGIKDVKEHMKEMNRVQSEKIELIEEIKKKVDDIDKNIFKLILILGSAGIGTIITIVQTLTHK